jgi:hypothetical protein
MAAPRLAPVDFRDLEKGRNKVLDPRSRSNTPPLETAVPIQDPPTKTVMQTGLFSPTGIYGSLPRNRVGSRRTRKKKTKKAGRRKSRR